MTHQPRKKEFWVWLTVASLVPGTLTAVFSCVVGSDYCTLATFLLRIMVFTCVFEVLFFFTFICSRYIIRGFFSGRSFIQLAALILLVAFIYAEEDWRGAHAWRKYKCEMEAKGEKFDFASFVPPPVPDDQNFALTPIVASSYGQYLDRNGHLLSPPNTNVVNRLRMDIYSEEKSGSPKINFNWASGVRTDLQAWQVYYRTPYTNADSAVTNDYPVAPEPQAPAKDVLLALSRFDPPIEELRQASQLQYSRFPLDYNTKPAYEIRFENLEQIEGWARVLQLRSVAELQKGHGEAAIEDIKLMFYLANAIKNVPVSDIQLTRRTLLVYAIQPIWEGTVEHQWSDAQLVTIQGELSKSDLSANYQFYIRVKCAECINWLDSIDQERNFDFLSGVYFEGPEASRSPAWWYRMILKAFTDSIPSGWFCQNDRISAQVSRQFLLSDDEVERDIFPPAVGRRANDIREAELRRLSPYNIWARMNFGGVEWTAKWFAFAQCSTDLARLACALERYRIAHGEYPDSLNGLSPQFIGQVPHDITNGKPLHYHRTPDGQFVLYSVGWKQHDNGGEVVLQRQSKTSIDLNKSDWVWQFPVK